MSAAELRHFKAGLREVRSVPTSNPHKGWYLYTGTKLILKTTLDIPRVTFSLTDPSSDEMFCPFASRVEGRLLLCPFRLEFSSRNADTSGFSVENPEVWWHKKKI